MAKPRLFVEIELSEESEIQLTGDHHHYLARVMRLSNGDVFEAFNGRDGTFDLRITEIGKRQLTAIVDKKIAQQSLPPALTLAFAPIKKARTDFIVEKATELGVRHIQPIMTEFTNSERVRIEKLRLHAIEAAEQCGGNFVPQISEPMKLSQLLNATNDQLLFCDECATVGEGKSAFETTKADAWTILIGPEGGFSPSERQAILDNGALRLSLGPRILRADTAVVSAVTLWQRQHGDWN